MLLIPNCVCSDAFTSLCVPLHSTIQAYIRLASEFSGTVILTVIQSAFLSPLKHLKYTKNEIKYFWFFPCHIVVFGSLIFYVSYTRYSYLLLCGTFCFSFNSSGFLTCWPCSCCFCYLCSSSFTCSSCPKSLICIWDRGRRSGGQRDPTPLGDHLIWPKIRNRKRNRQDRQGEK